MKPDGEAATEAVVDDLAAVRPSVRRICEEPPRGSSGSNVFVERAILSVTRQTKLLK